jgi:Uma2 family endonuclease
MGDSALARLSNPTPAVSPYRFTVAEFHRLGEAGILEEDDRVELIEGELINMAPIGSRQVGALVFLANHFAVRAAGRHVVSCQNPVQISDESELQPDLALLAPRADSYRDALPQPADVRLVIEVADSSLAYDRDVKIPLYGRSGIAEAWLIDLQRKVVTVYREPCADGYRHCAEFLDGSLAPAGLADAAVALTDLFG